jgi:hypothetical protein
MAGTVKGKIGWKALNEPREISVRINQETKEPTAIQLGQHWHEVTVRERWRIDDQWWREPPVSRMYFEVATADGLVEVVFWDLVGREWFRQRG